MTITKKKKYAIAGLSAVCALSLFAGVGLLSPKTVSAQTTGVNAATYFYDNLVIEDGTAWKDYELAKKFYEIFAEMKESGDFADGVVSYDLSSVLTSEQLKAYVENGDLEIPKAFGAARDAFLTDNPDLFYINFYKMTISVGKKGGKYYAYVDSGREANLYYENGFNTPEAVADAVKKYNSKVNEIVAKLTEDQEKDTLSERDAFFAREVNAYLAESIKYDYVAYDNKDDPNYIAAAYINTAYGGLVEGKAVCGGFSTSYKVIMDKLGVPCITVTGYTKNKDQNGQNAASNVYHMWNYVWLQNPAEEEAKTFASRAGEEDGAWYSVDVTWNSTAFNKSRYTLLNASKDDELHVTDGVISSSSYELKYPLLSSHFYGSNGETEGLQCSISYNRDEDNLKDDNGEPLQCNFKTVSYNGKSARRLAEEDGLYIVYKDAKYVDNDFEKEIEWMNWTSIVSFIDYYTGGIQDEDFVIQDDGKETHFYANTSVYATQFAVFDVAPDGIKHSLSGVELPFYYSDELANKITAIESSKLLVNQTYGTYTPAPYILSGNQEVIIMSDSMRDPKITDKVVCAENKAFVFEVVYDEPLHILNEKEPIGISFTSEHPNTQDYAKFFPVNSKGDYVELVEGYENSGSTKKILNTLRFKFGPSLMYEHNEENYHFAFTNVGSAKIVARKVDDEIKMVPSNKAPNPAYYTFGRSVIACPARFNYDGRLWIECCAQPTLIANSDLAEMDFKDENGNSTFSENERSQMMLVAERASDATVNTMLDEITDHEDISVEKKDILKSETYDITLQMCNKYPTIPDGSYVKIALGFPEGYGPKDEGVTFKLFHRKHLGGDNYIIEEVPCVVTQFGIVATVTSFSPYMVAVVPEAKASTDKTVLATIEGKGGKLSKEDGFIKTVKTGESCTYTIKPDDGYQVYSLTLNGKDVTDKIVDGKITLTYNDLLFNNELEIQYISNEAAQRYEDMGLEVAAPVKMIVNTDGTSETVKTGDELGINQIVPGRVTNNNNNNTMAIVLGVMGGVLGLAVVVGVAFIIVHAKKAKKN